MTTTARGLLAELDVDVPEAAGEKLQQLVDEVTRAARQMSPPFPEQPVGLGAQWSTTDEVQVSGFPLEQTAVYELTSFEDGKGTLEYEATQSAPSTDTLDIPGLPPGQTVRLESLTGSGTGRIEFDLSSPVTRTELCYSSSFSAVLVSDKGETPMTIEVEWSSLVHPSGDEVEGPADCDHSDATSATADSGS